MDFLETGPSDGPLFLFAHGAGANMDSRFMSDFANGLGAAGIRTVRFEFPYMAKRRVTGKKHPPDRAPKLLKHWQEVIDHHGGPENLFIGGKSMGGRMATMVGAELEKSGHPPRGVCVTGYPFHAPGKLEPENRRIDHLMEGFTTPTLICQGARDTFGWYDEVVEYGLPDTIDFHWLDDGDHDFKPRHLSGHTLRSNWESSIAAIAAWIKTHA